MVLFNYLCIQCTMHQHNLMIEKVLMLTHALSTASAQQRLRIIWDTRTVEKELKNASLFLQSCIDKQKSFKGKPHDAISSCMTWVACTYCILFPISYGKDITTGVITSVRCKRNSYVRSYKAIVTTATISAIWKAVTVELPIPRQHPWNQQDAGDSRVSINRRPTKCWFSK